MCLTVTGACFYMNGEAVRGNCRVSSKEMLDLGSEFEEEVCKRTRCIFLFLLLFLKRISV